jgi:hypothetical protein
MEWWSIGIGARPSFTPRLETMRAAASKAAARCRTPKTVGYFAPLREFGEICSMESRPPFC